MHLIAQFPFLLFLSTAKKKLEKQLSFMKKTVEEEKKRREEFGSKCSLAPVDRQMTQVQLSLQQVNQKLKEAQLQIQTVTFCETRANFRAFSQYQALDTTLYPIGFFASVNQSGGSLKRTSVSA